MSQCKRNSRLKSLTTDWYCVFSQATDQHATHPYYQLKTKRPTHFCTGSVYSGEWNGIGMAGFGTYIFPHSVEYEGMFNNSQFEGEGTLQYPMGQKVEGIWSKGKLITWQYRFADGQTYSYPWDYCKFPDRRFHLCYEQGLRPAGKELRTDSSTPRPIPPGCYDTGDGFYNPKIKCVISAVDLKKVLRIPTATEEQWIMNHCRKAWDEPVGYRPDLYKHWSTGRKNETYNEESEASGDSSLYTAKHESLISDTGTPDYQYRESEDDLSNMVFKYSEMSWTVD